MLEHLIQWMNAAETVLEILLVIRILFLRLYRPYVFITLFCVLSAFFDSVTWWLGWMTPAAERVSTVQSFFFAVLIPLAAWEAFEEISAIAAKWRKMELGRLISGVLLTQVFTLLVFANVDIDDAHGNSQAMAFAGLLCWAGCSSAALAFLWFTRRSLRVQKIELAPNTFVWVTFFIATNLLTMIYCVFQLVAPGVDRTVSEIGVLLLQCIDFAILAWCIWKLRRSGNFVAAVSAKEEP
jgi:hypothetical protein